MVQLSIPLYDIFTGLPPVLVMLVVLESVYYTSFPDFSLKSTGNEQVLDRGYNKKEKKRWRLCVDPYSAPLFYRHTWFGTLSWL